MLFKKKIIYFGQSCYVCCDGMCDKAFGIASRPRVEAGGKYYWASDNECGVAPKDPGTYEGTDGKPQIITPLDMNRWCARACERSCIVLISNTDITCELPNWNDRIAIED